MFSTGLRRICGILHLHGSSLVYVGVSWHILVDSDVRIYVLLVKPAGTLSTLHGSPSRTQPCRSMYMWSRHVYVGFRQMVFHDFESAYITDVFEIPNRDSDSRQGTIPNRRYRHIPWLRNKYRWPSTSNLLITTPRSMGDACGLPGYTSYKTQHKQRTELSLWRSPTNQLTPYAQSIRTCSTYATSPNPRVIIGVPDRVHIPLLHTQSTGQK